MDLLVWFYIACAVYVWLVLLFGDIDILMRTKEIGVGLGIDTDNISVSLHFWFFTILFILKPKGNGEN